MVTDVCLFSRELWSSLEARQQRAPPSWTQIVVSFHPLWPFYALLLFLPLRSENETLSNVINSKHRQLGGLSAVAALPPTPVVSLES